MICGTRHDPWMAFMDVAKSMLRGLASGDYGVAFRHLDANPDGSRWTRRLFESELARFAAGQVTTPDGHRRSAKPKMDTVVEDSIFELRHVIPLDGKWSDVDLVFRFTRKPGTQYYRVNLVGLDRR